MERILSLFDAKVQKFIVYLQNVAVIAGGSVLYILDKTQDSANLGDIDVFVNDEKILNDILYKAGELDAKITSTRKYNSGVTNIDIDNNKTIQIINYKYKHPNDIILQFDIDCVKCYLHKNNVHYTPDCMQSILTKKTYITTTSTPSRLKKIAVKGFETSVFGNDKIPVVNSSTIFCNFDHTKIERVDAAKFKIIGFKRGNKQQNFVNCNFVIKNNNTILEVKYVSLKVKIQHIHYNNDCECECIFINKSNDEWQIPFKKITTRGKLIPPDYAKKYITLLCKIHEFREKIYIKAFEVLPDNVIPLKFEHESFESMPFLNKDVINVIKSFNNIDNYLL